LVLSFASTSHFGFIKFDTVSAAAGGSVCVAQKAPFIQNMKAGVMRFGDFVSLKAIQQDHITG